MSYHKIGPDAVESFKEDLEVNMTYLQQHAELSSNEDFARSLCRYYNAYSSLSGPQMFRACQFWTEARENDPNVESTGEVRQEQQTYPQIAIEASAIDELVKRFDDAMPEQQYPAFKFYTSEVMYFRFFRTTERAKIGAGHVGIMQGTKHEETTHIGVLRRDLKKVVWSDVAKRNMAVQQEVKRIVENLVTEVAANGRKFSRCCFCALPLTNASSIHHGYGPICADHYGLPWGDLPMELGVTL